ncbi:protein-disulfide reductase DsbD family protein [Rahnella sikkimica]|uniref:Protein-disulfide reductase n=1 Tax=Rahnella sikkimica TaxID=1805933 RepID=A0A2L1UXU3_9GAMM|nr:protein-disulfide reductase DsbD domain-containing protein [Rahnella sikkimica]AVF37704.1 protein-disulfide reductase [Rahnella sikkimica]
MRNLFRAAAGGLLMLWLHTGYAADTGWLQSPQNSHAKVRLQAQPAPLSEKETRLLLSVSLEKGWKTYWRSPGEGGISPSVDWQKPVTVQQAKWDWPTPARFDVAGITTQGYHDEVTLPVTLSGEVPGTIAGTLTLPVCSNVCILTDYPFSLDLGSSGDNADFARQFAAAMGKVPIAEGLADTITAGYRPGVLQITAHREQGWQNPEVFTDTLEGSSLGKPVVKVDGQQARFTLPVTDEWGDKAADITGKTLSIVLSDNGLAQQIHLKVNPLPAEAPGAVALWQVALMALAGGFILNLMPCVLPVLGMKLGSILQVEQRNRKSIRVQFLASSGGVITSFLALALLMTGLRYTDQTLGWGIQFQSPWFIGLMVLVTALFTANLLGLFEINLPSKMTTRLATHRRSGLRGHFAEGAFATLLATPCSAPFLGTAVAFALAAPLPVLWGLFLMLGIGMSLPWLMIALWPGLAMCLPRPGRWMLRLRLFLGALMLSACLWLLSLMQNHFSALTVVVLAGILLVMLFSLSLRRYGLRNCALTAGAGALLAGAAIVIVSPFSGTGGKPLRDDIAWQPLSEEAIQTALAAKKVVFVDVTADWCVTCKANKYNVLMRDDVQQALTENDVVALRGDWTLPSKPVNDFLQKRGSVAVPFNQIYGPHNPAGEILSPLLTRDAVLQGLKDARGAR